MSEPEESDTEPEQQLKQQKQKSRHWMFYLSGAVTFYVIIAEILESQKISSQNPIFPIASLVCQVAFLIIFIYSFDFREFFRFSLLSATMLMVTIGILLGMNIRGHWDLILSQQTFNYGWPDPFLLTDRRFSNKFEVASLFFDLLYFSNILFFVKYVSEKLASEWLIRRREGRRP